MAAILAAHTWTGACTQSGPPQPDARPSTSQPDARPSADAPSYAACLDPRQLDADPPATFDMSGCLWHTLNGGRPLAVFTWLNRTGEEQAAPYGLANQVAPGTDAQGQPVSFMIGGSGTFAVPFDGSPTTWTILGQSVTVSQDSPDCGSTCMQIYYPGCMDCGPITTDLCTVACGDGLCDYEEECRSCPADCDCSALYPLVDCVLPLDGGKKLVNFGYNNRAATAGGLEIGPDNLLLPGQAARGQPVHFEVGEHHTVFQVTYGGPDVTWMLAGNAVTVPSDAPLCTPGCGASCTCVSNQCLGSCGDGLCNGWEGCESCPEDCACAAGKVCSDDQCGIPLSCVGVGLECGTIDDLGVRVDCGTCPDGQACNRLHQCEPICPVDPGTQSGP